MHALFVVWEVIEWALVGILMVFKKLLDCIQMREDPRTNPLRQYNKKRMTRNPCSSRNICQYLVLTRHWGGNCWRFHLEIHLENPTSKRKFWRVKVQGKKRFPHLKSNDKHLFKTIHYERHLFNPKWNFYKAIRYWECIGEETTCL